MKKLFIISAMLLCSFSYSQNVTTDSSKVNGVNATIYGTFLGDGHDIIGRFAYGETKDNLSIREQSVPFYNETDTLSTKAILLSLNTGTKYYYSLQAADYIPPGSPYIYHGDTLSFYIPSVRPTIQAYNLVLDSNIDTTSILVEWQNGNSFKRICMVNTINSFPDYTTLDGNDYSSSANNNYPDAPLVDGASIVYDGTGSSTNITGLSVNTEYFFKVIEYNGIESDTKYCNATGIDNPLSQTTLKQAPTTQSSDIIFSNIDDRELTTSWTSGNGDNRICIINTTNSFTPLTNATTYSANSEYQGGESIVYNGNGNSIDITGLTPLTTYYFKVIEYNNVSGYEKYNNDDGPNGNNPNSQATTAPVQSEDITFTDVNDTTVSLSWITGLGERRICLVNTSNNFPTSVELNGNDYSASADSNYTNAPTNIAKIVYDGTGNNFTTTGLSSNTRYYFKVIEYNGSAASTMYFDDFGVNNPQDTVTFKQAPTSLANNIIFSSISSNSITATWANGDGENRICIVNTSNSFTNLTNDVTYTANSDYQGNESIVYNGSGNSVTVTNLDGSTAYYFKVVEYNNPSGIERYDNTDNSGNNNPNSQITTPGSQAENITFSSLTDSSINVSWTNGTGNSTRICLANTTNIFPASTELNGNDYMLTADSNYSTAPTNIAKVVYAGSGSSINIIGLDENTQYFFKVIEYSGTDSETLYSDEIGTNNPNNTYTLKLPPTNPASDIVFSDITGGSMTISWTSGDGDNRACIINTLNSFTSMADDSTYTANSVYSSGESIIYNGSGNSINVTGLSSLTTYYFKVVEYNNNAGYEKYNNTDNSANNNPNSSTTITKDEPIAPSQNISITNISDSSMTISWEKGDGEYSICLANTTNSFSDITDSISYNADSKYGIGDQLTNLDYLVYNGNDSSVTITNLNPTTTYYFKIVEYNNTGSNSKYTNDITGALGNPTNETTLKTTPTTQATNITNTARYSTQLSVSWTNGDGDNRICLINTSNSFPSLINGTTYNIGEILAGGAEVLSNEPGNTAIASSLTPEQHYWFKIIEYNNTGDNARYLNSDDTNNPIEDSTATVIVWQGDTSSSWDLGDNWSSNFEPNSSSDITIPSGTTFSPSISSSGNQVNNITIEAGASITIDNGGALSVLGNATFKSPSNSGASGQLVIPGSGSFSVSGTNTYERYNPNDGAFVLAPITNANAYSNYLGYYVDVFDESKLDNGYNGWVAQDSASNQNGLNGWFLNKASKASDILSYNGTLNNGTKSHTFSNSGAAEDNGWTIVGNPYPCAIDVENSGFSVGSGLSGIVYVYNHGGGSPTYDTYNLSTHSGTAQYIAAAQGFWMEAISDGAQLTISNSARTNNSVTFKSTTVAYPSIDLSIANSSLTRNAKLSFIDGFTDALDNGRETKYLDDPWSKGMGIFLKSIDNKRLAENVFSLSTLNSLQNGDTLFVDMGILGYNGDSVKINSSSINNMPSDITFLLYNKNTKESVSLSDINHKIKLEFNPSEINEYNRGLNEDYQIALAKSGNALSIENNNFKTEESNIIYIVENNSVIIKSEAFLNNSGTIFVYTTMGILVNSKEIQNSEIQNIKLPTQGSFIIKIKTKERTYTRKIINI